MAGTVGIRRWNKQNRCPICNGHPDTPQGRGDRCWGFLSSDGRYAHCTRAELAGGLNLNRGSDAYAHRRYGACRCGREHDPAAYVPAPRQRDGRAPAPVFVASPAQRHAIYSRMLDLLGLSDAHRADLVRRGMSDEEIDAGGYRTLPRAYGDRQALGAQLVEEFGRADVLRVPGFFSGENGRTSMRGAGYLIPMRDGAGLIHMLQVRGDSGPKYTFMSGRDGEAKVSGLAQYHVAGLEHPAEDVIIIEGPLKGNIVAARTRCRVIALPGVAMPEATRQAIMALLDAWRPRRITLALDMDKHDNDRVLTAERERLEELAASATRAIYSAEWDRAYKGLDDLLVAGGTFRRVEQCVRPQPRARAAVPCETPGPIDRGERLEDVARNVEGIIGGRLKERGKKLHGTAKLVAAPPGLGKSRAVRKAIKAGARPVIAVSRIAQAEEFAQRAHDEDGVIVQVDYGRRRDNCDNFEAVERVQRRGYGARVGLIVCASCPMRQACEDNGYYAQRRRPGAHVMTAEALLQNPNSAEGRQHVILDDIDPARTLIEDLQIDAARIAGELQRPLEPAMRAILEAAGAAVLNAQRTALYNADARARLEAAVRPTGYDLAALLERLPEASALAPRTAEAVEDAPHGDTLALLDALRGVGGWAMRISGAGVELTRYKPLARNADGKHALTDKTVTILSATPAPELHRLIDIAGLTELPAYAPSVRLADNVRVTQHVAAFNGKSAIASIDKATGELHTKATARLEALCADVRAWFGNAERPAVITFQAIEARAAELLGIPPERVLHYYGTAGLNVIEDADAIALIGAPSMPEDAAYWRACALYPDEDLSARRRYVSRAFAGKGYEDGGRAIDVIEFVDERVQAVFGTGREFEMIQALHRARPHRLAAPQLSLEDAAGANVGREALARRTLQIGIFTAMPVPGLRVDHIEFGGLSRRAENARQAAAGRYATMERAEIIEAALHVAAAEETLRDVTAKQDFGQSGTGARALCTTCRTRPRWKPGATSCALCALEDKRRRVARGEMGTIPRTLLDALQTAARALEEIPEPIEPPICICEACAASYLRRAGVAPDVLPAWRTAQAIA